MGTLAVSTALRLVTESWSSRITFRLSKKSSRVTIFGATQMVSMSVPFSLRPRR